MNPTSGQPGRLIFLGEFPGGTTPFLSGLPNLNLEKCLCPDLDQLPATLTRHDLLITELAWLSRLEPDAKDTLRLRARSTANWIALTENGDGFAEQVAWQRAGVSHLFCKPLRQEQLAVLLDDVNHRLNTPPVRLLLIDAGMHALSDCRADIDAAGIVVWTLQDPRDILAAIAEFGPDLLLVADTTSVCTAPELVVIVRQNPEYTKLPIVFATEKTELREQLQARGIDADVLAMPLSGATLLGVIRHHVERHHARPVTHAPTSKRPRTARLRIGQLRSALNSHAIVSVTDHRGDILYVNDTFCAISGYDRGELLSQNHRVLKSHAHPAAFYQDLWHTLTTGSTWRGEICNRRKDGSIYWVSATMVPLLDDRGQPVQYISIRTDISALKQREAELHALGERFSRSQRFANIGTWDWDLRNDVIHISERIAPLFGGQMAQQTTTIDEFFSKVHPDDREAITRALDTSFKHDVHYEIEHRVVWPDGQVRWVLEHGATVRDAGGKPLSMLGLVQDIDDRKRAQLALAESERRLREAQSIAHIGNWESDLITGEQTWSDEIFRIFGLDPAHSAPSLKRFRAAVHPDDRESVQASERRAAQTGTWDIVHRIVRPDGSVRYVDVLARGERDADGQLVRLIGTAQDITDAKALEHNLELFRRIFDASDQCFGVTDSSGNFLYVNGSFETRMKYSFAEIAMRPMSILLPQDERANIGKETLAAVTAGKYGGTLMPLRCKDGSVFTSASHLGVVKDAHGKIQNYFNIFTDFTEELARRNELAEAKQAAEHANQAKSTFLSSMSHELRTPMNAIMGFAQILEHDDKLTPDQRDSAREILTAGQHLLNLINDVLDLARIEAGRLRISLEPVSVGPLMEDCRRLIQPLAMARKLSFDIEGLHPRMVVRADHMRLKQALINLLSNAIKYNREHGSIRVTLGPGEKNRLRITVTDTGPGIPQERLSELFQPFSRIEADNSNIEGTGMGLTITRRLVEMMGGSIGVHSQVDVGSAFWIELTQLAGATAQNTLAAPPTATPSLDALARQSRVLCIDDNPANLKLIAQILGAQSKIQLLTAQTPALGIELALAHRPDLILLDINMPGLTGHQVLKIFSTDPYLQRIPVIAVTANATPRDIEQGRSAGFAKYLTKPIDTNLLLNTVNSYLANAGGSAT